MAASIRAGSTERMRPSPHAPSARNPALFAAERARRVPFCGEGHREQRGRLLFSRGQQPVQLAPVACRWSGCPRQSQKIVGGLSHGGDDDRRPALLPREGCDPPRRRANPFRRRHGRAAEFEHYPLLLLSTQPPTPLMRTKKAGSLHLRRPPAEAIAHVVLSADRSRRVAASHRHCTCEQKCCADLFRIGHSAGTSFRIGLSWGG